MKITKIACLAFCLPLLMCYPSKAQNSMVKALALLKNDKEDTNKVNHLVTLCSMYSSAGKTDSALLLGNEGYTLASRLNFIRGKADALHNLGNVYEDMGNYEKALSAFSDCLKMYKDAGNEAGSMTNLSSIGIVYMDQGDYEKALENFLKVKDFYEKTGDKRGLASVVGNIGIVYRNQGNYPQAIENYFRAMKMDEELGNKEGVATNAGNLGVAFMNQNDFDKASEYYNKALIIYEGLGYKEGIAINLGNLAIMYVNQKNYPKALEYFFRSLTINKEIGDKDGIATNTGNLGHIYYEQGNYDEALKCFSEALQLNTEVGDKGGIAVSVGSEGEVYLKRKQYDKAEKLIKSALLLAVSIHEPEMIRDFNLDLSTLYKETARWQDAYKSYQVYTAAKDSLMNQDKSQEIGRIAAKEVYDKQLAVEQAENDKKARLAAEESKRQKLLIAFAGGVALAVAFVSLIIFRSLKTTRRQKKIIEEQKKEVEEKKKEVEKQKAEAEKQKDIVEYKNKDIVDSITYAKRLQDAILPHPDEMKKYLPQSFVLYKPRDIVAGDFYWMQALNGTIFIAACDCTGHGVPGAMVSVVCSNALNRTVKEFRITDPGKILNKVNELVIETFSQRDATVKKNESGIEDGTDISLCAITPSDKDADIKWAGANIPLCYMQNGEIYEIAANRQSIGKSSYAGGFVTNNLTLTQGDFLYLCTDGFAGQVGRYEKKEFGQAQFREQLSRIVPAGMDNQKAKLEQVFEAWKGSGKQTDDVLVIAIKI